MIGGVDQQAMLPDADLLDIRNPAQRGQHRDFVLQVRQFARRDGAEAGVAERRKHRHVAHREV